jgi:hypothetical protein
MRLLPSATQRRTGPEALQHSLPDIRTEIIALQGQYPSADNLGHEFLLRMPQRPSTLIRIYRRLANAAHCDHVLVRLGFAAVRRGLQCKSACLLGNSGSVP